MESLNFVIDADCAPAIAALRAAADGIDAMSGKTASVGIATVGGARAMSELNAVAAARDNASGDVQVGVDTAGIAAAREHLGNLRSDVQGVASEMDALAGARRVGVSDGGAIRGLANDVADLTSGIGGLMDGVGRADSTMGHFDSSTSRASGSLGSLGDLFSSSERAASDFGRTAERSTGAAVQRASELEMAHSGATRAINESTSAMQRANEVRASAPSSPGAPAGGQFNNRRVAGEAQLARDVENFLKGEAERGMPGTPGGPPIEPPGDDGGSGGRGGRGSSGGRGGSGGSGDRDRFGGGRTAMNAVQMGLMAGVVGEMAAGAAGLLSVKEVIKDNVALNQAGTQATKRFSESVKAASAGAETQGVPAMQALGTSLAILGNQVGATGVQHLNETLSASSALAITAAGALRDMDPAIGPAIEGLSGLADVVMKGISSPNSVSAIKAIGDSLSDPGNLKGFENLTGGVMAAGSTLTAAASDALGIVGRIPGMGEDALQGPMVAGGVGAFLGQRGLKGGARALGGLKGGLAGAGMEGLSELSESQGISPLWGMAGAGIGAVLGSILPGPGTMAGGAIGAALGTGAGFLFGGGDKEKELGLSPEQSKTLNELQQAQRSGLRPDQMDDPDKRHAAAEKAQNEALVKQAQGLGLTPQKLAETLGMSQGQAKKLTQAGLSPGGGAGGGGGPEVPVIGQEGAQGWFTGGGGGGASDDYASVIGQEGAPGWFVYPPSSASATAAGPMPQWDQAEWDKSQRPSPPIGIGAHGPARPAAPGAPAIPPAAPGAGSSGPGAHGPARGTPGSAMMSPANVAAINAAALGAPIPGGMAPAAGAIPPAGGQAPDYTATQNALRQPFAAVAEGPAVSSTPPGVDPGAAAVASGPGGAGVTAGQAPAGTGMVGTPGTGIGNSPGLSGVSAPVGGWPAPSPGMPMGMHPATPAPPAGPPAAPGAPPQSVQDLSWMGPSITSYSTPDNPSGMPPGWGQPARDAPQATPGAPAAPGGIGAHGPAREATPGPQGSPGMAGRVGSPANVAQIQAETQAVTANTNAVTANSNANTNNTATAQSNTAANTANAASNTSVGQTAAAAGVGLAGLGQVAVAAQAPMDAAIGAIAAAPASIAAATPGIEGAGQAAGMAGMEGQASGIAAGAPAVAGAASDATSDAGDAAAGTAGEDSPSKVWHQIGAYMTEGMAIGIGAAAPLSATAAAQAVTHTSTVAENYAANAGLKIGFIYGTNVVTGLSSVLDKEGLKAAGLAQGVQSDLAKVALGQLGLFGPAGSGASSWDLHKTGLVSFSGGRTPTSSGATPTVNIQLSMDGTPVKTVARNVVFEHFEELLAGIGAGRR